MSKLFYILAMFMLTSSFYAFAEETCPEGQTMDPDSGVCVEEAADNGS